jgi:hypothetical protein
VSEDDVDVNKHSDTWDEHLNASDEEEEKQDDLTSQNNDPFTEKCLSNYSNYVDRMKENFDRNRQLNVFSEGYCVGVMIPLELRKHGVQMLPAIVIRRLEKSNEYFYQLGVRNALLDRYYLSSELVSLNLPTFKKQLGIPESQHVFDVVESLDWWGWNDSKQSHTTIELAAAYELYVKQYTTDAERSESVSEVREITRYVCLTADANVIRLRRIRQKLIEVINVADDDDASVANELISLKLSTTQKQKAKRPKRKPAKRQRDDEVSVDVCCACDEILSNNNWHCCHGCKRPMHGKIICSKGDKIIVSEDDDSNIYCSVKCSKTQ